MGLHHNALSSKFFIQYDSFNYDIIDHWMYHDAVHTSCCLQW